MTSKSSVVSKDLSELIGIIGPSEVDEIEENIKKTRKERMVNYEKKFDLMMGRIGRDEK